MESKLLDEHVILKNDKKAISILSIQKLANQLNKSLREIEIFCLENQIIPLCYIRNLNEISISDQIKILKTKVAMIGLGGLGGLLFENLLRLGVGTIYIADGDIFDETNINRQALSDYKNIGKKKIEEAKKRASMINPAVLLKSSCKFLESKKQILDFLDDVDIAIDALGDLKSKLIFAEAAKEKKIITVSGACAGSAAFFSLFDHTKDSPATLMCKTDANDEAEKTLGISSNLAALVASLMSMQVQNYLCDNMENLNKVFFIDSKSMTFEKVSL